MVYEHSLITKTYLETVVIVLTEQCAVSIKCCGVRFYELLISLGS